LLSTSQQSKKENPRVNRYHNVGLPQILLSPISILGLGRVLVFGLA